MKEKILMLVIGILIGAIIASACFLLFYKGNTTNTQNIENGRPNMENFTPGDRQRGNFKNRLNSNEQSTTTEKTETNNEAQNSENQSSQPTNNQAPSGQAPTGQTPNGQMPSNNNSQSNI